MKTLPIAVEQRHAQRSFELLDPRCDARRHPMQLTRGFDDATFIDDALEHFKIDEVHGDKPILIQRTTYSKLFYIIEHLISLV